jgi:hypothetical protein
VVTTSSVSRRTFITTGAAFGAIGLAPSALKRLLFAPRGPSLTWSTFEPLVGDVFGVNFGGGFERVVLAQVKGLSSARSAHDEDRFALLFQAPLGPRRPDGIHLLTHPRIGDASVFLSSVDRGAKLLSYEAIFYRA